MDKKFRFKLNLFDGIVLILGLVVVAVLGYLTLKPSAAPETNQNVQTIRYTICLEAALEGTGAQVRPGDSLTDSIKNYNIGTVESVETTVARVETFDMDEKKIVYTEAEGAEDVYITVVAPAVIGENAVILDGGYKLHVNMVAYVRGEGFVGYGPVVSIERGEK